MKQADAQLATKADLRTLRAELRTDLAQFEQRLTLRIVAIAAMTNGSLFAALRYLPGTSSSQNTVWHGYQPYNPAMIGKYLTIFRTVADFISVGLDGRTPAMRLGLAKQPLTYEDILWPGERAPRPRRVRLKGRRLSALRGTPANRGAQSSTA